MKALCLDAASSIVKRIKFYCENTESIDTHSSDIKLLTEALSQLDNIIYSTERDKDGEKE